MTDAEKELRRLAEEAKRYDATSEGSFRAKSRMWGALSPTAVLALLDRIEALERRLEDKSKAELGPALDVIREPLIEMGSTFPGGGLLGIAEGIREVVAKAERKGAEEMRECASNEAATVVGATFGVVERIRALPLPGDAP